MKGQESIAAYSAHLRIDNGLYHSAGDCSVNGIASSHQHFCTLFNRLRLSSDYRTSHYSETPKRDIKWPQEASAEVRTASSWPRGAGIDVKQQNIVKLFRAKPLVNEIRCPRKGPP
jgi:hypothetical protein